MYYMSMTIPIHCMLLIDQLYKLAQREKTHHKFHYQIKYIITLHVHVYMKATPIDHLSTHVYTLSTM